MTPTVPSQATTLSPDRMMDGDFGLWLIWALRKSRWRNFEKHEALGTGQLSHQASAESEELATHQLSKL